jgi:membrane protease YdiL (CAAX protease family)
VKRDAAILGFAMLYPCVSAWLYFAAFAGSEPVGQPEARPVVQAAWGLGKAFQFVFPVLWIGLVERQRVWPSKPNWRGLSLGAGFGLLVALAGLALYYGFLRHHPLMHDAPDHIRRKTSEFGASTPGRFILFVSFLSVVHSLLEEYYWRWFVYGRLRTDLAPWGAIGLSSLAFMAYHVIDLAAFFPGKFLTLVLPLSACIAVGGAFWAWLYERTGSVYAPWVSHLLIDAAIMTAGYDLIFVRGG